MKGRSCTFQNTRHWRQAVRDSSTREFPESSGQALKEKHVEFYLQPCMLPIICLTKMNFSRLGWLSIYIALSNCFFQTLNSKKTLPPCWGLFSFSLVSGCC